MTSGEESRVSIIFPRWSISHENEIAEHSSHLSPKLYMFFFQISFKVSLRLDERSVFALIEQRAPLPVSSHVNLKRRKPTSRPKLSREIAKHKSTRETELPVERGSFFDSPGRKIARIVGAGGRV